MRRRLSIFFYSATCLWLAAGWVVLETVRFKLLLTAMVAALSLVWFPFQVRRRRQLLLGVIALCIAGIAALMPSRTASPEARVQSVLLDPRGTRQPLPWLPYRMSVRRWARC